MSVHSVQLADIKGLGPAKQDALRAAGIVSVEHLAGIDLRRGFEVQGITPAGLKDLKQRARRLLAAEGEPVPKAPYRLKGKARAPNAKAFSAEAKATPAEEKPGLLRRILTRRS